jgi:hypothetical protein
MFTFSPKFFPALLETVGLYALNLNLRDFDLLHFDFERQNCSSARCSLMANCQQ